MELFAKNSKYKRFVIFQLRIAQKVLGYKQNFVCNYLLDIRLLLDFRGYFVLKKITTARWGGIHPLGRSAWLHDLTFVIWVISQLFSTYKINLKLQVKINLCSFRLKECVAENVQWLYFEVTSTSMLHSCFVVFMYLFCVCSLSCDLAT